MNLIPNLIPLSLSLQLIIESKLWTDIYLASTYLEIAIHCYLLQMKILQHIIIKLIKASIVMHKKHKKYKQSNQLSLHRDSTHVSK